MSFSFSFYVSPVVPLASVCANASKRLNAYSNAYLGDNSAATFTFQVPRNTKLLAVPHVSFAARNVVARQTLSEGTRIRRLCKWTGIVSKETGKRPRART